MSIDLRVKHDLESRRRAVELFDAGVGCKPAAEALSVPRETVRWIGNTYLDDSGRDSPASLNSTGDM
jgi:orotate phosphoribosyltransferase-like protein